MKSIHKSIAVIWPKAILKRLGKNYSEAVNVFISILVRRKGLPQGLRIPNAETAKIIAEARRGENVDDFSMEELT